jgi:hypothetical protein
VSAAEALTPSWHSLTARCRAPADIQVRQSRTCIKRIPVFTGKLLWPVDYTVKTSSKLPLINDSNINEKGVSIVVFLAVMPFSLVGGYQRFQESTVQANNKTIIIGLIQISTETQVLRSLVYMFRLLFTFTVPKSWYKNIVWGPLHIRFNVALTP